MKKIVRIGHSPNTGNVYCEIIFENKKLSISGVEGPKHNGNCIGNCGQIEMSMDESYISSLNLAPGWNKTMLKKFIAIWRKWHLNDMHAGCEHQRTWSNKRINPEDLPHSRANRDKKGIYAIWVNEKEHPEGLLCKPCPVCGYKYGSAWLHEDVPEDVIDFLFSLPETDKTPAWI